MQRNERSAGGDHALYPDLDWKELLTRHLSLTKTAKIGALDAQKDPEGNGVKGNNGSESRPPMTFPVTQRNARILSSPPLTIVGGESDVAEEMTVLAVRENEGDGESRSQNSKSAGNIRDFLIGGKKNDAGLNNLRDSRLIISQSRPRPEPIPTTKQVSEDGWNHKQLNEGLYKLISSASLSKSEGIQRLTIDKKMADISPNTALSKKQHFSELAVEPLSVLDSPMKTAPATRRAQNIAIENAVLDDVKKSIRSFQKKGDNRMEIRLHPPYLGRLRIEINVNAKYVNTIIIADNHLVKEILEINANQLRDSLQEHGLQMEGFQVHVNAQGSRNGQEYDKPGYYRHGFDNVDDNHNPESQPQETQLWSEYGFSIFI